MTSNIFIFTHSLTLLLFSARVGFELEYPAEHCRLKGIFSLSDICPVSSKR